MTCIVSSKRVLNDFSTSKFLFFSISLASLTMLSIISYFVLVVSFLVFRIAWTTIALAFLLAASIIFDASLLYSLLRFNLALLIISSASFLAFSNIASASDLAFSSIALLTLSNVASSATILHPISLSL